MHDKRNTVITNHSEIEGLKDRLAQGTPTHKETTTVATVRDCTAPMIQCYPTTLMMLRGHHCAMLQRLQPRSSTVEAITTITTRKTIINTIMLVDATTSALLLLVYHPLLTITIVITILCFTLLFKKPGPGFPMVPNYEENLASDQPL